MEVNLDQIEFYHGPSRQPPSTSAKSVNPGHASAHVPQYFQHSFPTGFGFRPGQSEVPLGQSPPLTGTTHAWNIFDFEINNVYGHPQPEMTKDVEPAVTTNMLAAHGIPLDRGSSALAFSEPVPSTDSAGTSPCLSGADQVDHTLPDMRGNDLPDTVPDTKEMETSPLSCVPCVTAAVPAPEQANRAFSDLSVVGDSQQEPAKRKLSTTEPSDSLHPGEYENDTESSQASNLSENPCSMVNEAPNNPPERAEDPGTAEDTSATFGPSSPPTARSTSKRSRVRTALGSNIPVCYPSIAVVVPSTSWKQGAARTSTRAAAAVCKKRLRSSRGTGNDQDGNTTFYDTEQPCQKRKKRKPSIRPLSDPSDSSTPLSCHCPGAIQGIRGSALLTVESNSGLKPAYFFTFVPDPSPILSRPHTAVIPGKHSTYTSDENALLVRLKEKEAMSWSEITTHFPGRNISSLQVHYSTKLRHKASSRSGKPRGRE
ncbi:hypothetical protein N7494_005432 [Penicillium frequentans]|uniref:Myb-like domain-containing protein n=1 Tax=Penicillium frequentans TaxID=3151616 RepID=A0AAD6CY34_9EURO|nr:hypothetical protein N7494_005432 [Penicillium glabrum]